MGGVTSEMVDKESWTFNVIYLKDTDSKLDCFGSVCYRIIWLPRVLFCIDQALQIIESSYEIDTVKLIP